LKSKNTEINLIKNENKKILINKKIILPVIIITIILLEIIFLVNLLN
jgi:hypothetical protein